MGYGTKENAKRITNKVNSIKDDPFHFLEHFEGADLYKLRVGSYRMLVDVDTAENVISIRIAGHRRNIYRRRF